MQALVRTNVSLAAKALAKLRIESQTPERRKEIASNAAKARWAKWREKQAVAR